MILVDTGPLLAAFDSSDAAHVVATQFIENTRIALAVPAPVVFETAYLLGKHVGANQEATFLEAIGTGQIAIEDPRPADYKRASELVAQYADWPLGAVDAMVVALAERLGVSDILTLDRRHFAAIQPRHVAAFNLVP